MEKIKVSKESYKGHDFIDIRGYYENDAGEWRPGKKGLAINPDPATENTNTYREKLSF